MAYCLKCGAKLEEDDVVCPFCGGETGGISRMKQLSDQMTVDIRTLLRTEDLTDEMDPYETKAGRFPSLCAYLGPLLLIPILAGKKNDFTRFHANQGLVLLITAILSYFSVKIAGWIFHFIPVVGEILAALLLALWGIAFASAVVTGVLHALLGRAKTLPVIGGFEILK